MRQKLSEKYRPTRLADVVGQPAVFHLRECVRDPRPCCFLLEGAGGVGKTSAAFALANELGCYDDFSDLHYVNAVHLGIERVDALFRQTLRLRSLGGAGWHVLIIDELEALPSVQVQRALKSYLEIDLRSLKCVVVATSNGAGGLSKPLLQRFKLLTFSGGPGLMRAGHDRLAAIWKQEAGNRPMPGGWMDWGCDEDGDFSMRVALEEMETAIAIGGAVLV